MSKYVVVTGGAGFIGSNIIRRLNELGEENIIIVDNLGSSIKWRNLIGLAFEDYIHKDTFLELLLKGLFDGKISVIIHMGARSSTTELDVEFLMKNNYEYTKKLAKWAVENDVRFIYASSAATYGDGSEGFSDDHERLKYLRPLNPYGFSKHLFDLWAWRNGLLNHLVGLKYFNVFGPGEFHKGDMRSMVLKAYEQIKRDGKVRLFRSYRREYSDGEQIRDFIYVKDAVDMTIHFYENRDLHGIYNVGSGRATTWNELANAVFSALGLRSCIEYIEMPDKIQSTYQYRTVADISKIRATGYTKEITPFRDAVREYIKIISDANDGFL